MKKLFLLLILGIIFKGPVFSQQPTLWQSLPLDMNHYPTHILEDTVHGLAYLYGFFDKVGNDTCNIVRMDSSGFTLMPSAPVPVYNGVSATLHQGKLYFGGDYRIAVWNGVTWDSIPVSGGVYYLYNHDNKLYACGYFDSIAHTYVNNMAFWNDTAWTAIPGLDTFLDMDNSLMSKIIGYKNELYISGIMKKHDHTVPVYYNLIRFDGQHWKDVAGQIAGNQGPGINDMLVWKDTLYVCGSFRENNGGAGNGIAKWDGQNWHSLQQGVFMDDQPTVNDMMIYHNELYVTGWFNTINGVSYETPNDLSTGFAKWDGTKWCSLGAIAHGVMLSLGQFRDSLYVMGVFDTLNNQPMRYMAKWVGGDYTDSCIWQPTGIGNNNPIVQNAVAIYPNPVSGFLHIRYHSGNNQKQEAAIQIADLSGRVMYNGSRRIEPGDNFFQFDVNKLAPGMYFLTLINGQDRSVVKFVKQ